MGVAEGAGALIDRRSAGNRGQLLVRTLWKGRGIVGGGTGRIRYRYRHIVNILHATARDGEQKHHRQRAGQLVAINLHADCAKLTTIRSRKRLGYRIEAIGVGTARPKC